MLRSTRFPARSRFASAFALAVALAGGALAASAVVAPAVAAQDYTDAFVDLYSPAADVVNAEGGDVNSVVGQFPAILAAVVTPDDRYAAGNLLLIAGNKTNNQAFQRQGLELQLASGKVPPENIGLFNWFVGNLAFQANDYAASRAALQAAAAAGYTAGDTTALIAETYYALDDVPTGVAFVLNAAQARAAAGGEIPSQWLMRGLQAAYQANLQSETTDISLLLATTHTSQQNWLNVLQVANALGDFDDQAQLDMLRLMRLTGAMSDEAEYVQYIESADPRIMSNEVVDVLAEGLAAGIFSTTDEYYIGVHDIVESRMAGDRADAAGMVSDARAEPTGRDALLAGNLLYSLDDFAGAEEMFALAVSKGGADSNMALTRQAMAQIRQGETATALETLAQITGPRALVARYWAAYAQTQASAAPAN